MRCNKCHRPMSGSTAYDGACECGGLIEETPVTEYKIQEPEPNSYIAFHGHESREVGRLDFNGPKMVFTGDMEESAKIFITFVAERFSDRLAKEREPLERELAEAGETINDHAKAYAAAQERALKAEAENAELKASIEQGYLPNEIQLEDWAEKLRVENVALRADAERYRWLRDWLVKVGLLEAKFCQPAVHTKAEDFWILRRPYIVDGDGYEGYGKSEDAAIDAARKP